MTASLAVPVVAASPEDNSNENDIPKCFDSEHPPSCTTITTTPKPFNRLLQQLGNNNETSYDDDAAQQQQHQEICFQMQRDYFGVIGPLDVHRHMEAFASMTANNASCAMFRDSYPHCYWCSPLAATDYVSADAICDLERPLGGDEEYSLMDVAAACEAIRKVRIDKVQWLATIELCDLRRKIGHLCVDTCRNADPSKGCYTSENPPSCDAPWTGSNDNRSLAQTTCYNLERFIVWPQLPETHGGVLARIHADSEFCRAVRASYHQCYWCIADDHDNTTVLLPPTIQEYCTLDCFNVSQPPPLPVDLDKFIIPVEDRNATCQELSDIMERKQVPATMELCESYRQWGHLCPQLACGNYSYAPSDSCFSGENFPTCELDDPLPAAENDMVSAESVQDTCFTLQSEYLVHTDVWNVSSHAEVLSMIRADSDLCTAVKKVYPLCHWCSKDATIHNCTMPDCFTFEPPLVVDASVNITSACQELTFVVVEQDETPATSDLCYKLQQVSHLCPAVCGNYSYQAKDGCFTTENPPSCLTPPLNGDSVLIPGLDEQEICNSLFVDYLGKNDVTFDTSAHLSILSKIPANSEFCSNVRSVYHRCFWCAPSAGQGACSQQPPRMPYCSAPLALLRANVHHHEICAELESVYANYSTTGPMTIDLCQGLEQHGHVCPNLCIYIAGWNGDGDDGVADTAIGEPPGLCFPSTEDLPTCSGPTTSHNNDSTVAIIMDEEEVQHLCFLLDQEYWNDYSAEVQADILPKIRANTKLCDAAKRAFHLCHWCTPSTRQCNKMRKLCAPIPPEVVNDPEKSTQLAAACTQLKELYGKREWPASNNMCIASHTYGSWCPDFCENGFSEQGCFNYDQNPPTCQAPPPNALVGEYNVQDTCYTLLVNYLYPKGVIFDLSSHGQVLMGIHKDAELCPAARQAYHSCYWCDATNTTTTTTSAAAESQSNTTDFCAFDCSSSSSEQIFDITIDIGETCRELTRLRNAGEWPATTDLCHRLQQVGHLCPKFCEDFDPSFVVIDNPQSMVFLSRMAAILSLLGASFIMWDVLSSRKNRATVYHQLLCATSFFDIGTAIAWIFARMPIPKEVSFYVSGAMGTPQTCKAQAFFIQLGFTSVLYNVSLAIYYVLVIVMSWREHDLRRIRWVMHGVPLVIGVGLAFAGLPYYHWYVYGCHLLPPPFGELWTVLVFAVFPLGFSVLSITVSMMIVYLIVRRNARASRKWSFGVGKNSLESKVFWQALLYTLSFYVTWPIFFSVYIAATDYTRGYDVGRYALPAMVSFVAPLQGFSNFLVYARPRFYRFLQSRAVRVGSVFTRFQSATTEHNPSVYAPPTNDAAATAAAAAEEMNSLDPSAAIAALRHHPSEGHSSPPVQGNLSPDRMTEGRDDSCSGPNSNVVAADADAAAPIGPTKGMSRESENGQVSVNSENGHINSSVSEMNGKQTREMNERNVSLMSDRPTEVLDEAVSHTSTLPDVYGAEPDNEGNFYFI